jgi:hypothetical protein
VDVLGTLGAAIAEGATRAIINAATPTIAYPRVLKI